MIVKMKKITILSHEKNPAKTVEVLRKIGLLHVEHMQTPHADCITSVENKLILLRKAVSFLKDVEKQGHNISKDELPALEKEIIFLAEQRQSLASDIYKIETKLAWFKEWGDVSLKDVEELKEKGIFLKLYLCSKKEFKSIPEDKCVEIIKQVKGMYHIALMSRDINVRLEFTEAQFSKMSKGYLEKKGALAIKEINQINEKILKFSEHKKEFIAYEKELLKNLEFCKVRFGIVNKEGIYCLGGYCPKDAVSRFEEEAKKHGWAILVEEPQDENKVPTLVRYPRWAKIIDPVFKFMGTIPGYKEYDISPYFLLFFSLFFAMLIGDAGYGFVFLGITLFVRKKAKSLPPEPFRLMYVLSGATIVWGALTGTWFGFEKFSQAPFLNGLIVNKIYSFNPGNESFIQLICFVIGAVHLTIAHAIVAIARINTLKAIAQVGWISIIWGLFFLARDLVLNKPMPDFASWLFIVGAALIVFFGNHQKNILKGMLLSLADLPLRVISSFSDVVSYIRLFAVGYASVVVASSFNEMALGAGIHNVWGGLIAALILFIGHSLNIALGFMAIIVHGMRLNLLEFSGHLDMQWSGKEYAPFKE